MKVLNDYWELKLIIHYNIQHTCWGLMQKASSKMHVFVTVALHMSISKRRIQWTFATWHLTDSSLYQITFTDPLFLAMTILTIYLGISSATFYEFRVISIKKIKKQVLLSNLAIEQCLYFRIWTFFISNVWVTVIFWI